MSNILDSKQPAKFVRHITLRNQSSAPIRPASGNVNFYATDDALFAKTSGGVVFGPLGLGTQVVVYTTNSGTYSATDTDTCIVVTASGATVDLPATPTTGQMLTVKAMTNSATVDGNGKDIDFAETVSLSAYYSITLVYTGTVWAVVSMYTNFLD